MGMVLAVIFVASCAAPSFAYGDRHKDGEKNCAAMDKKLAKELNLTPEQQSNMQANRKAQREEMSKLVDVIKGKQQALREKMKDPSVTRAMVEPIVDELKSLHAKMLDQRVNGIFAVKGILTAEQFVKFQELMDKKRGEHKGKGKKNHSCKEEDGPERD